jgi:DNA-binding NarL/FixJ family response regulator
VKTIRIFIVDDHPMIMEGLIFTMQGAGDIEIVGTAGDAETALDMLSDLNPDLILLDLTLPGMSGLDLATRLHRENPAIMVVILTANTDETSIQKAIAAGARGYLSKDAGRTELLEAIRKVAGGGDYFSGNISGKIVDSYVQKIRAPDHSPVGPASPLSERELDILRLLASGFTFREVGDQLFISPRTVESHRNNIMAKLNLQTFADLVRYAVRNGLIEA